MSSPIDPNDLKDLQRDLVPADVDNEAVEKSHDEQMKDEEGPFGHEGSAEPPDIDKMRAAFNLRNDDQGAQPLPDFEEEINPSENLPPEDDEI